MTYNAGDYDIAVIGAGHAGCEAALASARMGLQTCHAIHILVEVQKDILLEK